MKDSKKLQTDCTIKLSDFRVKSKPSLSCSVGGFGFQTNSSHGRNRFTSIRRFPISEAEAKDDQKDTEDQRIGGNRPPNGETPAAG